MKTVLVFPPFRLESLYNLPPLGLINLATALRATGRPAEILDFVLALRQDDLPSGRRLYDACARRILDCRPDIVGFSTQCTTYPGALQIARRVKERAPEVRIVLGGHNASFLAEETIAAFPHVDAVVRGEGELTLPALVSAWSDGLTAEGVAGVTWRGLDGTPVVNPDRPLLERLDDLPLPDYGLVPALSAYRDACGLPRSIAILEVGRGCPHRCAYCSESLLWRRRARTFSIDRVVHEMHVLADRFGAECFVLSYDQFTASRGWVEEFCERVIAEGLQRLPWYCISRLDTVDAPLLALMRSAGCESMCYGIDSGSERTLETIHKRIDRDLLYRRVRETCATGIVPTLSYIVGFPSEEREDVDATLDLALRTSLQGDVNPLIQLPTVLAGTELHQRHADRLVRVADSYFSQGIEFEEGRRLDEDEELINGHPALFSSFYNLSCEGLEVAELDRLARGFPLVLQLYPRSFFLLVQALGVSPSGLFGEFVEWVSRAESASPDGSAASVAAGPAGDLCPATVYRCFQAFATARWESLPPGEWAHLPDVVAYESAALLAARGDVREPKPPSPLAPRTRSDALAREPGVVVAGFTYPIPRILDDLRGARVDATCGPDPCWLTFRFEHDQLETMEINAFGRDFLELCDGSVTVEEVAGTLHGPHGAGVPPDEFLAACWAAAETFTEVRLLTRTGAEGNR